MACLVAMATTALVDVVTSRSVVGIESLAQSQDSDLYAADPSHLWNRLDKHLRIRVAPDRTEYGSNEVDPLLWAKTEYLLSGPSHATAIRLLDEFLKTRGERLVTDAIKRAVFQHDLWAVFDWLASADENRPAERQALRARLARVIRRVALAREQIDGLPDNYAAAVASRAFADRYDPAARNRAFLPPDLFSQDGPWTTVNSLDPVATQHADELSRSSFSVLWSVPGGGAATLNYFAKLWDFPEPFVVDPHIADGERRVEVNPALPAVPDGTRIALVRQMLLIDQRDQIVPAKLTEMVQLRVFHGDQVFLEFRMNRRRLFADAAGGLEAVGPGDRGFLTFSSKGIDPFELEPQHRRWTSLPVILDGCRNCHHRGPAIQSVASVRRLLKPHSSYDSRHARWSRWFTQPGAAAQWKARRADWGLLQGLWQSNPW